MTSAKMFGPQQLNACVGFRALLMRDVTWSGYTLW
jgi:hypothetical protein